MFGFTQSLHQYWVDSSGNTYSSMYTSQTVRGLNTFFLNTPNVLSTARTYFSCSTLPGMPFENAASENSAKENWERLSNIYSIATKTLNEDVTMSIGRIPMRRFLTIFDVAALQDTGWYKSVDTTLAFDTKWGKGKGCHFITDSACNFSP